jgi:hypothetical protein
LPPSLVFEDRSVVSEVQFIFSAPDSGLEILKEKSSTVRFAFQSSRIYPEVKRQGNNVLNTYIRISLFWKNRHMYVDITAVG